MTMSLPLAAPQRIATITREMAAVPAWSVAGILASIISGPAWADCLPNPPASGQTVTCSGPAPTTVPLDASAASNVTVNINADAVVTGNGNLITLGSGAQLGNLGRIEPFSTGTGSTGVLVLGNNSVVRNEAGGTITTAGDQATGIAATAGTGHQLRNEGSIATQGQSSHGMLLNGASSSSMINAGSINTSGTGAHGLYVLSGARNTLENRGTVNTSGQRGNGMRADDGDSTFINSGDILVGGRDAFGVFMQGNNNSLLNSGTIRASGINADGVLSNTTGGSFVARIENTGSIISERSSRCAA